MMKMIVCILLAGFGMGCAAGASKEHERTASKEQEKTKEMEELIVKNDHGKTVMRGYMLNGKMEGVCVWYDGAGQTVSEGTFKEGKPHDGTFLDWSLFFGEEITEPYVPSVYAKDWVTPFESSFLSQQVDYSKVRVTYENGVKQNN
jgi:hypothetical protein